jgi:hypothetical protein
MSAIESQGSLSEDKEGRVDSAGSPREESDNVRLVPLSESIRYRRRAQDAEKRVEELSSQLAEANEEANRLTKELKSTQKEQELMRRLAAEGARDLEAAVLIAKARLAGTDKADLAGIVERLKNEKQYLFVEKASSGATVRTSPLKESRQTGATALDRAAKKAAGTGSRADLQEYMKRRRSVI